jgi:hypothetical protein
MIQTSNRIGTSSVNHRTTCRWIACAALLGAALPAIPPAAGQSGAAQVRACGLRIVAEPHAGNDQMRPFNYGKGTTLVLQVAYESGGLISFDRDAAKLETFADDKKNDLLTKQRFGRSGLGSFPKISDDGKVALIEISGGGVPARGSRAIRAKGTLVFQQATRQTTAKAENVALKKGTTFKAGPFEFEITAAGKPNWGDDPLQITLKTSRDVAAIKSIKFLDSAGKPIKSSDAGSGSMTFGANTVYERSINLSKQIDAATIELTLWKDMKKIEIPFDLTVGVGM